MARVWMYAMHSNKDPDNVRCVVPWQVDDDLIFFGPCKIRMRERLRKCYLREDRTHRVVHTGLYIVGVNGSNPKRVRKVVASGRLSQVMTFAEADRHLAGERFREFREHPSSPLHVRPVLNGGRLVGYDHASDEHIKNDKWVDDLTSRRSDVRLQGRQVTVRRGREPWDVFDRDCCMLLQNHFFARGQGIEFEDEAVGILKGAQPGKSGIDAYAVFGLASDGQVNGLRGQYLDIEGDLADRFVAWLSGRADDVRPDRCGLKARQVKTSCTKHPPRPPKRPAY
jgi:hypothetical protein